MLCRVLEVSRSGFYDYLKACQKAEPDIEQAAMETRIREIFVKSKYTYGSRRILRQLLSEGYTIGRYRVRSLMRKLNLKARGGEALQGDYRQQPQISDSPQPAQPAV